MGGSRNFLLHNEHRMAGNHADTHQLLRPIRYGNTPPHAPVGRMYGRCNRHLLPLLAAVGRTGPMAVANVASRTAAAEKTRNLSSGPQFGDLRQMSYLCIFNKLGSEDVIETNRTQTAEL